MNKLGLGGVYFKDGTFQTIEGIRMDQDVVIVTTKDSTYMYKKKERKFYIYYTTIQLYGDNKPLYAYPDWREVDYILSITAMGCACTGGEDGA